MRQSHPFEREVDPEKLRVKGGLSLEIQLR
jgi:hypothetical protein